MASRLCPRGESARAHGLDYFFGLKSGYHDDYTHHDGEGQPDLWENEEPIEIEGYTTDLVTQRAARFIDEHKNGPFFLDVSYAAPHWPYQVPGKPSVAPDNARDVMPTDAETSTRAEYVAMVEHLDKQIGDLLAVIDRAGIADETIVIFTNDNGGEWLSNNTPFFGRKWTVDEGGIRVPAIVRWPGRILAGRVSDQVGITMDLTASILAVTSTRSTSSPTSRRRTARTSIRTRPCSRCETSRPSSGRPIRARPVGPRGRPRVIAAPRRDSP